LAREKRQIAARCGKTRPDSVFRAGCDLWIEICIRPSLDETSP